MSEEVHEVGQIFIELKLRKEQLTDDIPLFSTENIIKTPIVMLHVSPQNNYCIIF